MKTKLSLAVAALVLGLQIGAPASARISADTLSQVEATVNAGDVVGFAGLLSANPELASIPGPLGAAIRAFAAAPNAATLAGVRDVASATAGISAAANAAANSIY